MASHEQLTRIRARNQAVRLPDAHTSQSDTDDLAAAATCRLALTRPKALANVADVNHIEGGVLCVPIGDIGEVVNQRHTDRVAQLREGALARCACHRSVVTGGVRQLEHAQLLELSIHVEEQIRVHVVRHTERFAVHVGCVLAPLPISRRTESADHQRLLRCSLCLAEQDGQQRPVAPRNRRLHREGILSAQQLARQHAAHRLTSPTVCIPEA